MFYFTQSVSQVGAVIGIDNVSINFKVAPGLTTDNKSYEFYSYADSTKMRTITVSFVNLTQDVSVEISEGSANFSVDKDILNISLPDAVLVVIFHPTTSSSKIETGKIKFSSPELGDVYVDLNGFTIKKTLPIREDFDYPVGSNLIDNGEWVATSLVGEPTENLQIDVTSLSYPNYGTTDKSVYIPRTNTRDALIGFYPSDGNTIYCSALMKVVGFPTANPANNNHIVLGLIKLRDKYSTLNASMSLATGLLAYRIDENTFKLGLAQQANFGTTPYYTESSFNINQTYLVVLKFESNVEGNNIATLYVNPDMSGAEPSSSNMSNLIACGEITQLPNAFLLNSNGATSRAYVGGIRIAKSWDELKLLSATHQIVQNKSDLVVITPTGCISKIEGVMQIIGANGMLVMQKDVKVGTELNIPSGFSIIKVVNNEGLFVQKIVKK
jgi:hypothetical protein